MAEWIVRLQGSSVDLQELADEFRSPQLSVREEGGQYFLRSSDDLDALTDRRDVLARASELLQLLVGIVKLRSGYAEAVTTDGYLIRVDEDGTRQRFVMAEATIRARAKVKIVWGSTLVSAPPEAEAWMALARRDNTVLDAVRFFQEETTWWSLRKAYEVIEAELKQPSRIVKLGWATLDEIKRFKEWAGHYVHGERDNPPDQVRYPVMSLPEAESFIQGLLTRWLRWKADSGARMRSNESTS